MMAMMGVCRLLLLLACVVSSMTTSDAAVMDEQSWNELERVHVGTSWNVGTSWSGWTSARLSTTRR